MAVRIRMKLMGRKHRPYYRIVAIDSRQPRDGRELEQLGTYDPMVRNSDGKITLDPARLEYWKSVGARVSEKVTVLYNRYLKQPQPAPAAAEGAPQNAEAAPSA